MRGWGWKDQKFVSESLMRFLTFVSVELDQRKYFWLEKWLDKNDSLVSETYSLLNGVVSTSKGFFKLFPH